MTERTWDPQLDALGVKLVSPDTAQYRLVSAKWLAPAEARDKHHIYVRILDEQGKPLQDQAFRVTNGGVVIARTKGPGLDDYYGNFPMFANGHYTVDIPNATSDQVMGLFTGLPTNPYLNTSFYLVFERGATITQPGGGEQPEPGTQPGGGDVQPGDQGGAEPQPGGGDVEPGDQGSQTEPGGSEPQPGAAPRLDPATRAQLLALIDQAQAEINAARTLLGEQ
jgi:hypothetical protein